MLRVVWFGIFEFQPGSPALLKMGGGCDGVANLLGCWTPKVCATLCCWRVLHVQEMGAMVPPRGNLEIQPGSPAVLKMGGGGDGVVNLEQLILE
jgi:hypothetical protein